jgi:hypothetical protein
MLSGQPARNFLTATPSLQQTTQFSLHQGSVKSRGLLVLDLP